jgi:hypothetical protein
VKRRFSEKDEAFWQKMVLPEEDRRVSLANTAWKGVGYRWFKSENIVCLEHYLRVDEAKPAPHQKAS